MSTSVIYAKAQNGVNEMLSYGIQKRKKENPYP